jgi:hypothetical protein
MLQTAAELEITPIPVDKKSRLFTVQVDANALDLTVY